MENFDWTSFTRKIAVKAPVSEVYRAWTTVSGIEPWFLQTAAFFTADGTATTHAQKGNTYEWTWFLYDHAEHGSITESNGVDFLQFTFAGKCLVDIQLSADGEYTIVQLTQKNIPTDDASKRDIRLGCHTGWSFYLVNLKSVLEGGADLRNKDERLAPMVNN